MIRASKVHRLPWLLVGDLNQVLSPSEKCGGGAISLSQCKLFQEVVDKCKLIDVEATGGAWLLERRRNSIVLAIPDCIAFGLHRD